MTISSDSFAWNKRGRDPVCGKKKCVGRIDVYVGRCKHEPMWVKKMLNEGGIFVSSQNLDTNNSNEQQIGEQSQEWWNKQREWKMETHTDQLATWSKANTTPEEDEKETRQKRYVAKTRNNTVHIPKLCTADVASKPPGRQIRQHVNKGCMCWPVSWRWVSNRVYKRTINVLRDFDTAEGHSVE